jgi:predicted secreted hydrolase
MGKIVCANGTGIPHTTFDDVWLTHKKCSEWWYCTGYFECGSGEFFAYQFTLAHVRIYGIRFMILICSVTDLKENKHYNTQTPIFFGKGVTATADTLAVEGKVNVTLAPNTHSSKGRIRLQMNSGAYSLDVEMEAVKPPVWHCDKGVLQMGIPGDKERTFYYSLTNLASKATLAIGGKTFKDLSGKTWFDRQGGTYTLTDPRTCWEWFSLRFFDNTEAMLFAFPQDGYCDGTFIEADGTYRRLNEYSLEATDVITFEGKKFSNGWSLVMNGNKYTITPKTDGMFNVFFFELLADILDASGKTVGFCFVELLPGVRNKSSNLDAFKKR